MAAGLDMTPLLELLVNNEDVLKVFHAGGQDLEIVYNLTGKTPHPLFDTQIAAMALGQGEQVGYSNLVDAYLGIVVDKGARFTDWSRRPLDARQIEYAIGDVTHLARDLPAACWSGCARPGAAHGSTRKWNGSATRAITPTTPKRPGGACGSPGRKPDVLGRLKALARWREIEAQNKNLPRGRIVKDETIADLAAHPPRKQADLAKVRGLSATWAGNEIGARLMAAIESAEPMSADELPMRDDRKPGLGKDGALVADLLKLLLKIRVARHRCRLAPARAERGPRGAGRGSARGAGDPRRMALRPVRSRRARPGRGAAGLCGAGRQAEDDTDGRPGLSDEQFRRLTIGLRPRALASAACRRTTASPYSAKSSGGMWRATTAPSSVRRDRCSGPARPPLNR